MWEHKLLNMSYQTTNHWTSVETILPKVSKSYQKKQKSKRGWWLALRVCHSSHCNSCRTDPANFKEYSLQSVVWFLFGFLDEERHTQCCWYNWMVQWQVWIIWAYACSDSPASSWSSADAVILLAFTCETVPATQDLCPRTWIFAFLQNQSSTQNLRLYVHYAQHKDRRGCPGRRFCCTSYVHVKVGVGGLSPVINLCLHHVPIHVSSLRMQKCFSPLAVDNFHSSADSVQPISLYLSNYGQLFPPIVPIQGTWRNVVSFQNLSVCGHLRSYLTIM